MAADECIRARFQRDDSQCRFAPNYCTKWQTALVHRTASQREWWKWQGTKGAKGALRLPRIDARECKCKIAADPFFSRLSAPHCLRLTFLLPSHASPSISARSSPSPPSSTASHCYVRTDKLISSGKSCSCTFPVPFSALRKIHVPTRKSHPPCFFFISPRMNMSPRFITRILFPIRDRQDSTDAR